MKLLKTIFLARHGTTQFNEDDVLQGRSDQLLNERGFAEAEALAGLLRDEKLEVIYHSPLVRTRQTAEAVAAFHREAPLIAIDAFAEIDLGEWENRKYQEVIDADVKFHVRWVKDPNLQIPGGESFVQVYERAQKGLSIILASPYGTQLVVGHATINRGILGNLLQIPPGSARLFRMKNCALSKIMIYENPYGPHCVVDFWNDTHHLRNIQL